MNNNNGRIRNSGIVLALTCAAMVLAGCNNDADAPRPRSAGLTLEAGNIVQGVVAKGVVGGAAISLVDASGTAVAATTSTDDRGVYRLVMTDVAVESWVQVVADLSGAMAMCDVPAGCNYLDAGGAAAQAAWGERYAMPDGTVMRAIVELPGQSTDLPTVTANVTPLTEVMTQVALAAGDGITLDPDDVMMANTAVMGMVEQLYPGLDIADATFLPGLAVTDITDPLSLNGPFLTEAALVSAAVSATPAALADPAGGTTVGSIMNSLAADLGANGALSPANSTAMRAAATDILVSVVGQVSERVTAGTVNLPAGVSLAQLEQYADTLDIELTATGAEQPMPLASSGNATATIGLNPASGAISIDLRVSGIEAVAAHLHEGYAGDGGGVLIPLADAGNGRWISAAGAALDADGIAAFLAGRTYVNVHTAAYPGGEIRGQVLPDGVDMITFEVGGNQVVPVTATMGQGWGALTHDTNNGLIHVHVTTTGVETATAAHVHQAIAGRSGGVAIALAMKEGDAGHWFAEAVPAAENVTPLMAAELYVNVHTPVNPGGEIRGQIVPTGMDVVISQLDAANSVSSTPVVSDGTGSSALTIDLQSGAFTLHVNTQGVDDATAAHIHSAAAGANGPVAVGLTQDETDPGHWSATGTLSGTLAARERLGLLYVNVHTPGNPAGELRGQIADADTPAGMALAVQLDASRQTEFVDSEATGQGEVVLDLVSGAITIVLDATGMEPTAAHLHQAFAGDSGGVNVGLEADAAVAGRFVTAEGAMLSPAGMDAFLAGGTYLNVHSATWPGGEIRGQVLPAGINVSYFSMGGEQSVPAVATAATGLGALTVDNNLNTGTLHARVSGADDATAAHIHSAIAGETGGVLVPLSRRDGTGHWFAESFPLDETFTTEQAASRLYVNVHTPANPSGELRGQIVADGDRLILFTLDGEQAVPPVASAAVGQGAITLTEATGVAQVHVNTVGVDDATAAHLHAAAAGSTGGVAVGLEQDAASPGHWFVRDSALDQATMAQLDEGSLYANVHTPTVPSGEIRGQVIAPPVMLLFSELSALQSVSDPAVMSEASGKASLTVNMSTGAFELWVNTVGVSDATAAHIHEAAVGANGGVAVPLTQSTPDRWTATGMFTVEQLASLQAGTLYVNVHTPAYPGGEIRGQLVSGDQLPADLRR